MFLNIGEKKRNLMTQEQIFRFENKIMCVSQNSGLFKIFCIHSRFKVIFKHLSVLRIGVLAIQLILYLENGEFK